jgi:hypothetical protein
MLHLMNTRTFLQTAATLTLTALLGACDVDSQQADPEDSRTATGKILLVASSPTTATTEAANGWPLGAWIAEVSHPYYELVEAGYEVEIRGGRRRHRCLLGPAARERVLGRGRDEPSVPHHRGHGVAPHRHALDR